MEKSLAKMPAQGLEAQQQRDGITVGMAALTQELISKAVDSKAAVEVIKDLRAMRDEDMRRGAEVAFDAAFSVFQATCPVIIKGKSVATNSGAVAYKYAPIEEIEAIIRPIERENGFTHTFNQDVASQPGWVIASCTITHKDQVYGSFSKTTVGKFPIGSKTQIMSDTQVYASALTFCNRRVLANAYGLVLAGEDKDGAGKPKASSSARVVTPDLRNRFFEFSKPWHAKLHAMAIDLGWVMPDEGLDAISDEHIPLTKGELAALQAKAEKHQ